MHYAYNQQHNGYFISDGTYLTYRRTLHILKLKPNELEKILIPFNYDIYDPFKDGNEYIRFSNKEDTENFVIILKMVG